MDDDLRLLEAIKSLDHDAIVMVFDCYAPSLYKFALRLCANPSEADDIVGDVFAELLKQLKKGEGPRENLRSYLYQIAYHKVVDHTRKSRQTTGYDEAEPLTTGETLHSQNERRDELGRLEVILQKNLTPDQRDVIVLRFLEDLSIKETAAILGKNENNIKVIQNRAIARIRKCLESQE